MKDENFNSDSESSNNNGDSGPEFGIQKFYAKDISFEAPSTPQIFRENWQPDVNLDLQSKSNKLDESTYEVVVSATVTVKTNEKVAFIAEVQYAGIFTLRDFPNDQMNHMLGSFCPSTIFPYARERLTDLIVSGGFPPIYLAPINFDAIYQHQLQQKKNNSSQPLTQPTGEESFN